MIERKKRVILLRYLRQGMLTAREVAYIAAVSRQAVEKWCERAGIDLIAARHNFVVRVARRIYAESGIYAKRQRRARRGVVRQIGHR
jgi:hypothetical protein